MPKHISNHNLNDQPSLKKSRVESVVLLNQLRAENAAITDDEVAKRLRYAFEVDQCDLDDFKVRPTRPVVVRCECGSPAHTQTTHPNCRLNPNLKLDNPTDEEIKAVRDHLSKKPPAPPVTPKIEKEKFTIGDALEKGLFFFPTEDGKRLYDTYGAYTIAELDSKLGFNDAMGALGPDSVATMMMAMNATDGNMQDQFDKLHWIPDNQFTTGDKMIMVRTNTLLSDGFNIVSNILRARIGEKGIWYRLGRNPIYGFNTKKLVPFGFSVQEKTGDASVHSAIDDAIGNAIESVEQKTADPPVTPSRIAPRVLDFSVAMTATGSFNRVDSKKHCICTPTDTCPEHTVECGDNASVRFEYHGKAYTTLCRIGYVYFAKDDSHESAEFEESYGEKMGYYFTPIGRNAVQKLCNKLGMKRATYVNRISHFMIKKLKKKDTAAWIDMPEYTLGPWKGHARAFGTW